MIVCCWAKWFHQKEYQTVNVIHRITSSTLTLICRLERDIAAEKIVKMFWVLTSHCNQVFFSSKGCTSTCKYFVQMLDTLPWSTLSYLFSSVLLIQAVLWLILHRWGENDTIHSNCFKSTGCSGWCYRLFVGKKLNISIAQVFTSCKQWVQLA